MPQLHHPGLTWRGLIFARHLRQYQVAASIGISRQQLSRILNGKSLPGADTTARFAQVVEQDAQRLWAEVTAYQFAQRAAEGGGK
jgi:transcriptional regulator with XRE-family HTH domain